MEFRCGKSGGSAEAGPVAVPEKTMWSFFLKTGKNDYICGCVCPPGMSCGESGWRVNRNILKLLRLMKPIVTSAAPAAIGPYSQAIEVNGFVYASGQLPIDPATGAFPEGGVQEQTRQSLLNVKAILEEAGLTLANVVKTTVYLADMGDFAAMNEIYSQFFSQPFPARSAVAVKALPKGALVEVEVIAARG